MEKFRHKNKQTNQSIHPYNHSLYPCDGMLFPMVSLVHQKKSSMANIKLSNINYQLLMIRIKKKSTKPVYVYNNSKNSWKIVNSVISFGSRNLNYIQYSVVLYTHTHIHPKSTELLSQIIYSFIRNLWPLIPFLLWSLLLVFQLQSALSRHVDSWNFVENARIPIIPTLCMRWQLWLLFAWNKFTISKRNEPN